MLRATPVPAGVDPEQRFKLAVGVAEQALACMRDRPTEAAGILKEAQRQLGQARGKIWAELQPKP